MLVRPALREYRTWVMDSRRWAPYQPRAGDIIIATYPKCGTTWMQRIVNLLIFQTPDPAPLDRISPWIDRRLPMPLKDVMDVIAAQGHRRAMKTHLPIDGLPLFDEVRYIHVARDGRDAVLSFHNHAMGFTDPTLAAFDAIGLADDTIARPYPRLPADPAAYFHQWLLTGAIRGQTDGYQTVSYFELEKGFWDERRRENILFVHYCDLKADLEGEMRRVATFLSIDVPSATWPSLVEAARFETMKKEGSLLMPGATSQLAQGKDRFFNKGETGRWRDLFRDEDLTLYDAKLSAMLAPDCIEWLTRGRAAQATAS
ncbi:sulfotransferase domain-containing protein [soil metagenome]